MPGLRSATCQSKLTAIQAGKNHWLRIFWARKEGPKLKRRMATTHLTKSKPSELDEGQGLKPLFFKLMNVAAEAATHKRCL
jgi:hypothetical protein